MSDKRIYRVEHVAWAATWWESDGTQTILQSALAASTELGLPGPWIVKDELGNQWEVDVQRVTEWRVIGPTRDPGSND